MMANKFIEFIKQNIKQSQDALGDLGPTYKLRLGAVFVLNVIICAGIAVYKENFPLPILVAVFSGSAYLIIDMLWHLHQKRIKDHFPNDFVAETQRLGEPQHSFKCRLISVGKIYYRGFGCRLYVYDKVILVRAGKNCLLITDGKQIKFTKMILWRFCTFTKNGKTVRCEMNKNKEAIIKAWADKADKGRNR